jgi:Flp pilus assembly protein CpaB
MLTVMLAALLAVFGIVAVLAYVQTANKRAIADTRTVFVLVAQQPIPSGTSVSVARRQGLLLREPEPFGAVPKTAVLSVTSDISSLVASVNIPQGSLLLRPMLVKKSQRTAGLVIPPGLVAVTMQVCLAADVAGYVKPGNKVAVYNTYTTGGSQSLDVSCNGGHQAASQSVATRMVLPNVSVLSVSVAGSGTSTSTSGTLLPGAQAASQGIVYVTLAATPEQAKLLTLVNATGFPSFALTPQTLLPDPTAARL